MRDREDRAEVVITGASAVTPFGVGLSALLDGLAEGRSAVRPIEAFDARDFPIRVAAEVPGAGDPRRLLASARVGCDTSDGILRDRKVAFALLAAVEAWESAGCGAEERDAWLAVGLGLETPLLEDFDGAFDGRRIDWRAAACATGDPPRLRAPLDLAARAVVAELGLRGPVAVSTSACAAGAMAVGQAAALIARGAAEVVVCGGADSMVSPLGIAGMDALGALSPRNALDACRPFDVRRDGTVMGEGAAFFVVEHAERARARGARALARIVGFASRQDAHGMSAPREDGRMAGEAIACALARAGRRAKDISYVNAHGTGTPLNDPAEARALRLALGDHAERVKVSSIKGAIGHGMAASGAIELAACLLPYLRDKLPGTAHLTDLDPECPLDLVRDPIAARNVDLVLSNSFGFGGQNAAVLLGRAP